VPRLFTGLEIPADIAADLAELRGGFSGARWIEPDNYHITLRFIGDIKLSVARDIADALSEIRRPRLVVEFEGLSWFGADRPRAIVAKIRSTPPLLELQAEHERQMRRIGLAPETRKFTPHVTLARLRAASPLAVADYLGHRAFLAQRRFEASRFVLYSARASTGGGPYLVEAAYALE
jgi:RNA 2',3'-cyclic 3'-phosphodiesterase